MVLDTYLDCGYSLIPLEGKKPIMKNWIKVVLTRESLESYVAKGFNIGCRLSRQDLVIDVDNHGKGSDGAGMASLTQLEKDIGYPLSKNCPTVITGSGGYHFYLRLPPDVRVKETLGKYPGIEFKSYGRQVVIPDSIHPDTLSPYTWSDGSLPLTEVPTANEALIKLIRRDESSSTDNTNADKITNAELKDLLSQIPVTDFGSHDAWFPILAASHHATGGQGVEEFIQWSLGDPKYAKDEHIIRARWNSLGGKTINYTVNTLYKTVLQYGGNVNRVCHDFDDIVSDIPDAAVTAQHSGVALRLAESLTEDSTDEDIIKAIKASVQANTLEQIKSQKIIRKAVSLSVGDFNKIVNSVKEDVYYDVSRKLAETTINNRFNLGRGLVMNNGQFWMYNGKYWQPIRTEYVGKTVIEELDAMRDTMNIEVRENTLVNDTVSLMGKLTSSCEDKLRLTAKPYPVINCDNGELWINDDGTVELKKHNPHSYLLQVLNVRYDPKAECPKFDESLLKTFSNFEDKEDIIRHLYEMIGYIIHPDKHPAHWWLLKGPGNDGKSTIMKIVSALLGDSVLPESIERFNGNDNHATTELVGKLLVYDDDLKKNYLLPDGLLKKLSENGELTANPKGFATYRFQKACTVVMCCNGNPRTQDLSNGFRRRAMIIPFRQGFKNDEIVPHLAEKIIATELPGILNKALEGLKRLRTRGEFLQPKSCLEAKNEWLSSANSIHDFIQRYVVDTGDPKDKLTLTELYDSYTVYAIGQNIRNTYTKQSFRQNFEDLGAIRVPTGKSHRAVSYFGYKLLATDDFEDL